MIKKTLHLLLLFTIHCTCFAGSNDLTNSYGTLRTVYDPNGELSFFTSPSAPGTIRFFYKDNVLTTSFVDDYSYREINIVTAEIKDVSKVIKRIKTRTGYREIRETRNYHANNIPTTKWLLTHENELLLSMLMQFNNELGDINQAVPLSEGNRYLNIPKLAAKASAYPEEKCAFEQAQFNLGYEGSETFNGCKFTSHARLGIAATATLTACTVGQGASPLPCLGAIGLYALSIMEYNSKVSSCKNSFAVAEHNLKKCEKAAYGTNHSDSDAHYGENGAPKIHVELRCEAWSLYTGTTADGWYCDRWGVK